MNIGIIIHSYTGNTHSVAEKIKNALVEEGQMVTIDRVTAVNEDPNAAGNIRLKSVPDISDYDVIIFGAPVRAFSLSPVMKLYISGLKSIEGKKTGCYVTQFFPFACMGGNNAIRQIVKLCKTKGAAVFETGIVNWSNNKDKKIGRVVSKMSSFKGL